jgi:BirA family biotin operon repressor/biotin-[acetyl-CoA-carboxylase] ligase
VTHPLGEVDSTQDEARRRASGDGAAEAILVVADRQTSGRGRSGAAWVQAPRAMSASLAVHPSWEPGEWPVIPLAAGLAARSALSEVCGVTPGLKWPNDLVLPTGKVGGILSEASGPVVVVGCGVNLWWPQPVDGAAAIHENDPGDGIAGDLAHVWADELLVALERPAGAWGLDEYRAACVTLGTEVVWDGGIGRDSGRGIAVDVASDGALVVAVADGTIALRSGSVRSVGPASLPHLHPGDRGAESS